MVTCFLFFISFNLIYNWQCVRPSIANRMTVYQIFLIRAYSETTNFAYHQLNPPFSPNTVSVLVKNFFNIKQKKQNATLVLKRIKNKLNVIFTQECNSSICENIRLVGIHFCSHVCCILKAFILFNIYLSKLFKLTILKCH